MDIEKWAESKKCQNDVDVRQLIRCAENVKNKFDVKDVKISVT